MATVTITSTTPEPAVDQRPPMLRLHLMTGAELMEMVERIANRRREFTAAIRRANDPDTVLGESRVTAEQDARNSRPYPY